MHYMGNKPIYSPMRFMWNMPVFLSLLGLGTCLLVFVLVVGMSVIKSIFPVILSLIVGIDVGVIVALVEAHYHKQKQADLYQPTETPYYVEYILLVGNILLKYQRVWIGIIFGSYLLTLAFVFRKYEVSVGRNGIKWNEIFPEKMARSSSEEKK